MEKINVEKLVEDIKSGEKTLRWSDWCKERGLGRESGSFYFVPDRVDTLTALYTLRAHLRGRLHRKNPPAPVRDFNRTMEEQGREPRISWDAVEHNRKIAEAWAPHYRAEGGLAESA